MRGLGFGVWSLRFGVRRAKSRAAHHISLAPNLNPFSCPLSPLCCCRLEFCFPARIFPRFASLINRARAREAIKPYLFSLWMVGITVKRTAIHRTRRRQEGEDFGVSSVERLRRELTRVARSNASLLCLCAESLLGVRGSEFRVRNAQPRRSPST